ncbi:MAG TPA: glycosyltransferase family 39 protein [Candidatus Sulfotelmatobacter sp.]|nr:glycosyltransferase family 39 protein [Candidatus Sulfotelmatobacter sp.]
MLYPVVSGMASSSLSVAHRSRSFWRSDTALLVYIAAATVVIHWIAARYSSGFHRDELATLDDARHLAWGYVAYPPVTPFFARISLTLFGTSLAGFRFFASLANAVVLVLIGIMTRDLGGRRGAQLLAAFAGVPACLAIGSMMQYVSFDYLAWVMVSFCIVRLLKTEDPRWWLGVGASVGFGMLSKYAIPFFVAGVVVGLLLTPARRYLRNRWLWLGVALSLLIFLPNLIWQIRNHFVYLDFVRYIHARDVRIGRTAGFLPDQLKFTMFAAPLWLAGLWFYFASPAGRRFRLLGWMYVTPLIIFLIAKGRGYYLIGAYPMLYAAGSVWGEQWISRLGRKQRAISRVTAWTALAVDVVIFSAIFLPLTPPNSRWWQWASSNNGDLREEVGWPELVETIAQIRNSLSPQQRARLGILTGDYGSAGAVDLYGPTYGLPPAISGTNSFWQRGYGDPAPETLIIVGFSRRGVEEHFTGCRIAARAWNRFGVINEQTGDRPDIFVCGPPRQSWPDFWKSFRHYG